MDVAAFTALRSPLEVTVGGLLYDVDPPGLQAWAAALAEPIPLLGLLPHDQAQRLNRRLRDDDVDLADLTTALHDVLELSADFPWHVTVTLLRSLVASWADFSGALGKRGVDALALPLDQAVSTMWALLQDACADDDARAQLRRDLWEPPAGSAASQAPAEPLWTPEDEGADWLKAAAATSNLPGVRTAAG